MLLGIGLWSPHQSWSLSASSHLYLCSPATEQCSSVLSLVGLILYELTESKEITSWWHFQYIFQTDSSREIQTGWIEKKNPKTKTNKQNTVHTVYANLPHIFGSCDIPLSPQKSRILILYTLRCCFWISLHKIVKKSSLTKHCNPLLPQNIPGLLEKWLENPTQILFSYQPIRCVDLF